MTEQLTVIRKAPHEKLNKTQKVFNTHVNKIKKLTEDLAEAEQAFEKYRAQKISKSSEVEQLYIEVNIKLLQLFDAYYDDPFFRKGEKEKIADIVYTKTCLYMDLSDDNNLYELNKKYKILAGYEDVNQRISDQMKSMFENTTGFSFDDQDVDFSDPESVEEAMREWMETKRKNKKKTKRELALDNENIKSDQILKNLYKELLKVFHPDKELDEAEKIKKTEITKQITDAYKKKNFYKLLALKIERLNTDLDLKKTAEEELKYYNRLLVAQVNELERKMWILNQQCNEVFPNLVFDFLWTLKMAPERIDMEIKKHVSSLKADIKKLNSEYALFTDKKEARKFLKEYEIDGYI
jgi:hypothetical protein